MSIEPPEPPKREGPEEPQPRDERWDEMRATVEAALEIGFTDVSDLTDILNRTRNEDLRAAFNDATAELTERMTNLRTLLEPFLWMLKARDFLAEKQAKTEATLLDRINAMSKETESPDGLYALAATYAQLRATSVAPGWYEPDIRHTDKPDNKD